MNQVLRINSTDLLCTISDNGAAFSLLFRGTRVKFYGGSSKGGALKLRLDGKTTTVLLDNTINDPADGTTPVFISDNLEDGDHQLLGGVESRKENGVIIVDHFEVENSSGGGFGLLWAGPNATNVPKEANITDGATPDITTNQDSLWSYSQPVSCYGQTISYTDTFGASLHYTFNGVAIWYYGGLQPTSASFTVSIDGSTPRRVERKRTSRVVEQQMLWSNTSLDPGRHTFTLTHDDEEGTRLSLDFLRILHDEDASALPLTTAAVLPSTTAYATTTTSAQSAPSSSLNTVSLVVGLTLGLLAFTVLVFAGIFYRHRRRRGPPTDIDAYPILPTTQVHPPPEPSRAAGAYVAVVTGYPTASFGRTELGPPPSYGGRVHGQRVGKGT